MISTMMVVLFTLLFSANIFLLCALAYSGRRADRKTKAGFYFMSAVLVLDMLFSVGGVALW